VFLSNPCEVNYWYIALIEFIIFKLWRIFDVRADVIVKLFIIKKVCGQ